MENILDLWNQALAQIEKKLSKPSFETWMKSTKAHSLQGDTLTITAPNEFARDWLESRYLHLIADTIYELTGEELSVKFVIPQNQDEEDFLPKPQVKKRQKRNRLIFPKACLTRNIHSTHSSSDRETDSPMQHHWLWRKHPLKHTTLYLYTGSRLRKNPLNARDRPLCH